MCITPECDPLGGNAMLEVALVATTTCEENYTVIVTASDRTAKGETDNIKCTNNVNNNIINLYFNAFMQFYYYIQLTCTVYICYCIIFELILQINIHSQTLIITSSILCV